MFSLARWFQAYPYLLVECTPQLRGQFASIEMLLQQFKAKLSEVLRPSLDGTLPDDAQDAAGAGATGVNVIRKRTFSKQSAVYKVILLSDSCVTQL